MSEVSERDILNRLTEFDTPSITNAVATYPKNPHCLGLYEPWRSRWYTDRSVRSQYPELGRLVGYAVTAIYSLPNPSFNRLTLANLLEKVAQSRKPAIIVIEQDFPPEILPKVGLCGGLMTEMFKACGAVAVITNGPSRDVDEIRPLGFQYITGGTTPGHGEFALSAIDVPVSVAGMDVSPEDIIHLDENGACKFPRNRLADVYRSAREFAEVEKNIVKEVRACKSAEDVVRKAEYLE